MNATERLYRWLNNATFVEDKGCSHPLDVIAVAIGCSERTVIRAVKQLECEGRIRVKRSRTRGRANTYWVDCWNPSKRCGVLAVLAGGREEVGRRRALKRARELSRLARRAECHPKENSSLSKGSSPLATPSLTASVNQRCGREARNPNPTCETCGRTIRPQGRCRMADPLRLPVDCDECARKDRIIRQYAENHSKLVEEVSSAHEVARAAGKEVTNLKHRIIRQATRSAKVDQVRSVIEHWKKHRPKTKASSFPPGGKNWQTIEKALNLMAEDDDGPVRACCEAIDGLHIAPFEAYGRRYMKDGPNRTLRNRIEHALGDETRIERCRGIVRRVRGDEADRLWELCQVAEATHWALQELLLEKLGERRRGPVEESEPRFVVDGVVTRSDG